MTGERMVTGPLRVSTKNPRYFENLHGRSILLAGSHTWSNFQDLFLEGDSARLDYQEYLDMLVSHHHNFTRMWQWDHPYITPWTRDKVFIEPMPYRRTGPGTANDGLPRFNLDQWNDEYFIRLQDRVAQANECGIYVLLMFFESWSTKWSIPEADAWLYHPFNAANNVNGMDGDIDGDGRADIYCLAIPDAVERQKAFIRRVIDAVGDFDNILFEIANEVENTSRAAEWQFYMIDYVKEYERERPKQHPVGMSAVGGEQDNSVLFASPGDWIAPGYGEDHEYENAPPVADGRKVILSDTDHLWGHGGNYLWAWQTFLRGMNPVFMDPWCPVPGKLFSHYSGGTDNNRRDYPDWEPLRINLGYILEYSKRIDLNLSLPMPDLSSSRYCLAEPGRTYIVLCHDAPTVQVDLSAAKKMFTVEWFAPITQQVIRSESVRGGRFVSLQRPFEGPGVAFLFSETTA